MYCQIIPGTSKFKWDHGRPHSRTDTETGYLMGRLCLDGVDNIRYDFQEFAGRDREFPLNSMPYLFYIYSEFKLLINLILSWNTWRLDQRSLEFI